MKCPYCNENLSSTKMLDFTCTHCSNKGYVRVDPGNNTRDYLSREEAEQFDKMMDESFRSGREP